MIDNTYFGVLRTKPTRTLTIGNDKYTIYPRGKLLYRAQRIFQLVALSPTCLGNRRNILCLSTFTCWHDRSIEIAVALSLPLGVVTIDPKIDQIYREIYVCGQLSHIFKFGS